MPSEGPKGFVVVSKRWGVEQTFAWMGRNKRLSKDYEKQSPPMRERLGLRTLR